MGNEGKAGGDVACGKNGQPQVRTRRKDKWTARNRTVFLEYLAATCNVRHAAAAVEISPAGAYALRRRNPEFSALWSEALECGYVRLETMLLAQAAGTHDAAGVRAMDCVGHGDDPQIADVPIAAPPIADKVDFDAGALLEITDALDKDAAFRMLALYAKNAKPPGRRGGHIPAKAGEDQLAAAIEKQLSALNRRRGGSE